MQRVLVTVSGADHPGITAELTQVVAASGVSLLNIEQVVVHGQLILALLLGIPESDKRGEAVLKELLFTSKRLGLGLEFMALEQSPAPREARQRLAVTAIGETISARVVSVVARVLAEHGANIETIRELSEGRLGCFEIIMSVPASENVAELRAQLVAATTDQDIDLAVERESLLRRSKRLVVMDMDSTLIRIEVIDELARMHGVLEEVATITAQAMAGDLDFEASLRKRVSFLKGLEMDRVMSLARDLPLTEGARDLLYVLKTLGYKTAVISGGFAFAAETLRDQLGLDYAYANRLQIQDGKLTGVVLDPIVSPQRKADLLDTIVQSEGISLDQTIAIGDGANDSAMLQRAGLGIAFHAKAKLKESADTAVSRGGLDRILFLLGLHVRDVEEILRRG